MALSLTVPVVAQWRLRKRARSVRRTQESWSEPRSVHDQASQELLVHSAALTFFR